MFSMVCKPGRKTPTSPTAALFLLPRPRPPWVRGHPPPPPASSSTTTAAYRSPRFRRPLRVVRFLRRWCRNAGAAAASLYLAFIRGVVGGGGRLKRRRTWSRRSRIAVCKATKLPMRAGPTNDKMPWSPSAGRRAAGAPRGGPTLFLYGARCTAGSVETGARLVTSLASPREHSHESSPAAVPPLVDVATRPPTPPSDDPPPHL